MPTLLAIIPHPDDESYSFGGTIALAARAGWRCVVVCASSGERGKRYGSGDPLWWLARGLKRLGKPGLQRRMLAGVRERELAESCRRLGAEGPRFWRLPDGALALEASQGTRVAGLIGELRPDMVLTLGADGAYGHPDHLAAHRWVVEGWQALPEPRPVLLFAAFPAGLFLPQYEKCIGMMGNPPSPAPGEIGTRARVLFEVDIQPAADEKLAAIGAHRSQLPGGDPEAIFPPGIVAALLDLERFEAVDEQDPLPLLTQLMDWS